MYADKITESMQRTINETQRRREKQMKYNVENNITPTQIVKNTKSLSSERKAANEYTVSSDANTLAADPVSQYMSREQLQKAIKESRRKMEEAAKNLDFMEAAMYRDEMFRLQDLLKSK